MFLNLFRTLGERLKAMFSLDAALDIEAQLIARNADRKAALLAKADELEAQGRGDVACDLRQRAISIDWDKPLDIVMPALTHAEHDPSRLLADSKRVDICHRVANGVPATKPIRGKRKRR